MKNILLILIFIFYASSIYANEAHEQYLSLMGFTVEESSLLNIRKKLGKAEIVRTGDAADSLSVLCYVSSENNTTVTFESGEMGGSDLLLSFSVKSNMDDAPTCGVLNKEKLGSDSFNVGPLRLNEKITDATSKLPKPIKKTPTGFKHTFNGKIPFNKAELKRYREDNEFYGRKNDLRFA